VNDIIKQELRRAKTALSKKEYYEAHKEELNVYHSNYQKEHRERINELQRIRRERKRNGEL
jgi:hypothetical protein